MWAVKLSLLALFAPVALGDVYMHVPRGSNNRNRERNENRNNGDRLFDSQNNDKGGYAWAGEATAVGMAAVNGDGGAVPAAAEYCVGSKLPIEFTAQHASGDNPSTHSMIVIQYGSEKSMQNSGPNLLASGPPGQRRAGFQQQSMGAGIRDGYPTGALADNTNNNNDYNPPGVRYQKATFTANGQNDDGTNTIQYNANQGTAQATQAATATEFGMHETPYDYQLCSDTMRNKGLYTADQNLNNNAGARATRQNNNGNRRGLECPEERDYYPYWRPTGFCDVAVLTSNLSWSTYYQSESQNVKKRGICVGGNTNGNGANQKAAWDKETCATQGGTWTEWESSCTGPPAVALGAASRQNNLGAGVPTSETLASGITDSSIEEEGQPESSYYEWTIPQSLVGQNAFIRLRYNISGADYESTAGMTLQEGDAPPDATVLNQLADGNDGETSEAAGDAAGGRPLGNRPYIKAFDAATPELSIALNTNQNGRTFQDRSYLFKVKECAAGVQRFNAITRGRRGNIVQSYPSVEYDMAPKEFHLQMGEAVVFNFENSEFNAERNANNGEGWKYSGRMNLLQVENEQQQMTGKAYSEMAFDMTGNIDAGGGPAGEAFFTSEELAKKMALLDQETVLASKGTTCKEFENGDDNEQNDPRNCGKLNSVQSTWRTDEMVFGTDVAPSRGAYYFADTRNNNFSNRSQKFLITAVGLTPGEIAAVVSGALVFVIIIVACCAMALNRKGKLNVDGVMETCELCYVACCGICADSSKKKRRGKRKKKRTKNKGDAEDYHDKL